MKNFKKFILITFVLTIAMLPILSFAQSDGSGVSCNTNITSIGDVICKTGSLLNLLIPVLIVLGIVYFVWGIITYVISSDDEEAKKKGKSRMIYGIIGLVVIVALWGLVGIVINTFGLNQGNVGIVSNLIQNNSAIVANNIGTCTLVVNSNLGELINYTTCIINNSVIPLIFSLAVAVFIWGVVQFVINTEDETKREKGKQFMIWGIIGLVVMVGVWGLVKIVGSTFGIEYVIPQLKGN